MPSEFHDLGADVAADALLDQLAEPVVVRVQGKPGRSVDAIVDRGTSTTSGGSPFAGHPRHPLVVRFKNCQVYGLTPSEAVETTTIEVEAVLGSKSSRRPRPVTRLVNQDMGMVSVEVNL